MFVCSFVASCLIYQYHSCCFNVLLIADVKLLCVLCYVLLFVCLCFCDGFMRCCVNRRCCFLLLFECNVALLMLFCDFDVFRCTPGFPKIRIDFSDSSKSRAKQTLPKTVRPIRHVNPTIKNCLFLMTRH